MAPLPANNTARYFVYYKANGKGHKLQFRYVPGGGGGQPEIGFRSNVTVLCNTVAAWMPTDLVYVKATYTMPGSNVELPADLPLLLAAGASSASIKNLPAFLSIVGKSPDGRAWKKTWIGAAVSPAETGGTTSDYRAYASEGAVPAAIVAAARELEDLTIDGEIPIINDYVNMGYNAYWQQQART